MKKVKKNSVKMKIAFFEIEDFEKEFFKKELKEHELMFFQDPLTLDNVNAVEDVDILCIFIGSTFTKKMLKYFTNLKGVITMSTGYDHIDVKTCYNNNICVSNTPYYGENTIAEHTFALLLALSRKIIPSVAHTKKRNFSLEGLRGFDLKGKTIGVVGTGNIGQHVIKIAKGFGMHVLAYNRTQKRKLAQEYGFSYVRNFNDLLGRCDIVTFHLPLTKDTRNMLNTKNITYVKKGCIIINTSRGEIIDGAALIYGLEHHILAGVGLDVLEDEKIIKEEAELLKKSFSRETFLNMLENNILLNYDNVIVTPHNAFNTQEALMRIMDTTLRNIKGVIEGDVQNPVQQK